MYIFKQQPQPPPQQKQNTNKETLNVAYSKKNKSTETFSEKCQIADIRDNSFTLNRMISIKNKRKLKNCQTVTSVGEEENLALLYTTSSHIKWCNCCGKYYDSSSKNLK